MTEELKRKPPSGRRFQKGQSGNPRGTSTGSRPRAMLALDALGHDKAGAIVEATAQKAIEGDAQAATVILNRVWPARKGRPTPLPLPTVQTAADTVAALGAVVAAIASGELSAEEAQAVASVLEAQRRSIEMQELEARIAALEQAREP